MEYIDYSSEEEDEQISIQDLDHVIIEQERVHIEELYNTIKHQIERDFLQIYKNSTSIDFYNFLQTGESVDPVDSIKLFDQEEYTSWKKENIIHLDTLYNILLSYYPKEDLPFKNVFSKHIFFYS